MSTNNGWFQKYHDPMWSTLQEKLGPELKARADAKKTLDDLIAQDAKFKDDFQKAAAKEEKLLKEMETSDDPVKKAKQLAKLQQEKAATRQGRNFLQNRIRTAQQRVKEAQSKIDSRFKNEVAKLHEPLQEEINQEAEALAHRISQYEKAISTLADVDVKIGFGASNKQAKPWLTLRVSSLEEYI